MKNTDVSPESTDAGVENKTDERSVNVIDKSDDAAIQSASEKMKDVFSEYEPADDASLPSMPTSDNQKDGDQTDTGDTEEESTPEENEEEEEEVKDDEEATEEDAEQDDTEKGAKEKSEDGPKLNDNYVRAAIHSGWSEEDVNDLYENNPELALKTFGNIYESLRKANKEFADFGRLHKQNQLKQAEDEKKAAEEQKEKFKGIDIEKLREDHPDDGGLVDMFAAMQEQTKVLHDTVAELKTSSVVKQTEADKEAEVNTAVKQINDFFTTDVEGYEDFYGVVKDGETDWDSLSPGQRANRWAVCETVEEMMTGAKMLGRELKTEEAFSRAHLSVSDSIKEQVIRKKIVKKMEKRSKNLSLKPTGSSKDSLAEKSGTMTKKEIETRAASRMSKVFK